MLGRPLDSGWRRGQAHQPQAPPGPRAFSQPAGVGEGGAGSQVFVERGAAASAQPGKAPPAAASGPQRCGQPQWPCQWSWEKGGRCANAVAGRSGGGGIAFGVRWRMEIKLLLTEFDP